MAKKKQEDPPKGSPAWMATFSDLMNILLCFFVLLFAMSNVDEAKQDAVIASLNQAFSVFDGGAQAIGDGILISNGVSQLNELDDFINSTGKLDEGQTVDEDMARDAAAAKAWTSACTIPVATDVPTATPTARMRVRKSLAVPIRQTANS